MKHQRFGINCLLLIATVVFGSTASRAETFAVREVQKDSVHIQLFDNTMAGLERKIAESKKEGKKVILFCHANWDGPSAMILKKAFKDEEVAEFFNVRFNMYFYDISNYDNNSKTNDKDMVKIVKKYASFGNHHLENGNSSFVVIDPDEKLNTVSFLPGRLTSISKTLEELEKNLISGFQGWLDGR